MSSTKPSGRGTSMCKVCGIVFPGGAIELSRHQNDPSIQHSYIFKRKSSYPFECENCHICFNVEANLHIHTLKQLCVGGNVDIATNMQSILPPTGYQRNGEGETSGAQIGSSGHVSAAPLMGKHNTNVSITASTGSTNAVPSAPVSTSSTGVMVNTHPNEPLNHMHAVRAQSLATQAAIHAKTIADKGSSSNLFPASGGVATLTGAVNHNYHQSVAAASGISGQPSAKAGEPFDPTALASGRPCVVMADGSKHYPCYVCGKQLESELGLDRHQRSNTLRHYCSLSGIATEMFPAQCAKCKICVRNAEQLAMHQKVGYCVANPSQLISHAANEVSLRRQMGSLHPVQTPAPAETLPQRASHGTQSKITAFLPAGGPTNPAVVFANKKVVASVNTAANAAVAAVATLAATPSGITTGGVPPRQFAAAAVGGATAQAAAATTASDVAVTVDSGVQAVVGSTQHPSAVAPTLLGKHPLTPALSSLHRRSKRSRVLVPRERQLYYNICSLLVQSALPVPALIVPALAPTAGAEAAPSTSDISTSLPQVTCTNFEAYITDEATLAFLNTLKDVLNCDAS